MVRSPSRSAIVAASFLGLATGLRSLLPLAVLSRTRSRTRGLRAVLLPLAAMELVADKLPRIPSRLAPVPLAFRFLAGGLGAAWLTRSGPRTAPVLAGAAGALAGALLGARARAWLPRATATTDLPWAVLEDLTSAALARASLQLAPR